MCLQRYGIGGEFPFCLEGHSAFDCIRVKVPFCFRTVVIIIPAITFHAIYNLLIAYGGAIQYIAYILPVLILTVGKLIVRLPQSHN